MSTEAFEKIKAFALRHGIQFVDIAAAAAALAVEEGRREKYRRMEEASRKEAEEQAKPVLKTKYDFNCPVTELQEGDIVHCLGMSGSPFSTGIVHKIDGEEVTIYRPYGIFSQVGICYMGGETIHHARDSNAMFHVYKGERPAMGEITRGVKR